MTEERTSSSAAISRRDEGGGVLLGEDDPASVVELDREHLKLHGVHTQTCPQCGINPSTGPKKRTFRWAPPWLFAVWLWGALTAAAVSPLISIGVLGLAFLARRKVTTMLSLCDDCDHADVRARRIRGASVTAGFVTLPIAALALAQMSGWGWFVSPVVQASLLGVVAVAGVAGAVFAHLKTSKAALFVKRITPSVVRLKASPTWRRVLRQEAPKALAAAHKRG